MQEKQNQKIMLH